MQIPYRGNTQSLAFPLLSTLSGRTVIDGGPDQVFYPQVSTDGSVPIDRGIPQAFYAHNVMPSTYGWQSVGYKKAYNEFPGDELGAVNFQSAHLIQAAEVIPLVPENEGDPTEELSPLSTKTYIAIGRDLSTSGVFVISPTTKTWKLIANGQPNIPAEAVITVAFINGISYIYISNVGCFIYNSVTDTLIERDLDGLEKQEIIGILASNGYLIAWSRVAVAWSSVVDVEDFVPSDITGAGGGNVQEAQGIIITGRPTFLGFILYTTGNAVSVTYSGNEAFPWNFKNIPSSGGIASPDLVALKEVGGYQYAYTTHGIQQITHQRANTIFPSITDFLSGQLYEDFNAFTNTFSTLTVPSTLRKKIAVISDRYVVLSYGPYQNQVLTHAIIVDLAQSRYGKLKIVHNFCFERLDLEPEAVDTPRESIALLQSDGATYTVDFAVDAAIDDTVLILGKFQLTRDKFVELHEIEVENVRDVDLFDLRVFVSLDGKSLGDAKTTTMIEASESSRRYGCFSLSGKSVSLLLKGKFNLISFVLWFTQGGRF